MRTLQGSGLDKRQPLDPGEAQDTKRRFLETFLKFLCQPSSLSTASRITQPGTGKQEYGTQSINETPVILVSMCIQADLSRRLAC